jgi:hypothetical protein
MKNKETDKPTDKPVEPVYTNWDYPTWIKNNPNATEKEIKAFLKQRQNMQKLGF